MLSKRSAGRSGKTKAEAATDLSGKRRSAIEYTILGIAWKRGPRTTYALMKELANSTSTYYKSRAGTAYPVVDRLVTAGLLTYSGGAGSKGERLVEVTTAGEEALLEWLTPPIEFEDIAHTVDFIRLRTFYLGAAQPEVREAFISGALTGLGAHLKALDVAISAYQEMGDTFSALATRAAVHETRARMTWLEEVREAALSAPVGKPRKNEPSDGVN